MKIVLMILFIIIILIVIAFIFCAMKLSSIIEREEKENGEDME